MLRGLLDARGFVTAVLAIAVLASSPALAATGDDTTTKDGGYLGVYLVEETEGDDGANVEEVAEGSPAAQAGIRAGDLIVALNGERTPHGKALIDRLVTLSPGERIHLRVSREGWEREVQITLAARPAEQTQDQPGFFGVFLRPNPEGAGALVDDAVPGSPAAAAGIQKNDVILVANGQSIANHTAFVELLRGLHAGDELHLRVSRQGWEREFSVTLGQRPPDVGGQQPAQPAQPTRPAQPAQPSRPQAPRRGFLGVSLTQQSAAGHPTVEGAVEGSPAARAGVQPGDVIVAVDGQEVSDNQQLIERISGRRPGDRVRLTVERGGWRRELDVELGERPQED